MKKFEVKYMIGSKGYKQTVEAETEALAKQKVLASVKFVSVDEITENSTNDSTLGASGNISINDLFSGFDGFDAIFGGGFKK